MSARAGIRRGRNRGILGVVLAGAMVATSCGSVANRATTSSTTTTTVTSRASVAEAATTVAPGDPEPHRASHNGGGRLAAPLDPAGEPIWIHHASLTTQNWATYDYQVSGDSVTASMPARITDPNVREVFWRVDTEPAVDEQTCITWDQTSESVEGEPIQPGLALRIASVGSRNEGLRAVTLTENVLYAGTWLFNVHVWDTRSPVPMTLLKTFDVSGVVGRIANVDGRAANYMVQPPWHLCGRVVGDTFTFKVWTQDNPEPSWQNPNQVFSVQLPPGWVYAGYSGGYIGHLHPGQSATATAELPTPID